MACRDCLQNCNPIVQDRCVQYTGDDIPLLGICSGDSLSEWEYAVVQKLLSVLNGTGITVSDVTIECDFLEDLLNNAPKTLKNLLQMLITASCTLKELVDTINTELANNPSFDTGCLTGLPANPTRDDILQATVDLVCSINTIVSTLDTTYVKISDLTTLVTTIVNNIITGGGQQSSKMVAFVAYEYYGSLSNFDAQGVGRSDLGFNKVYLCNGLNGTPDKRGRVAVGAIRNVPGGTLAAAVDPANPLNPNWGIYDLFGENNHQLTVAELAAHTHTVVDPGHRHSFTGTTPDGRGSDGSKSATIATLQTAIATTGITIASAGSNLPHNNIQPAIAAYYIMFIP